MNNTNRFLNRLFLFLVGVVLVALGAALAAVAFLPVVRDQWESVATTVDDAIGQALRATPLAGTEHSWLLIAAAAVLAILMLILLVAVFRRGGGHTATIATTQDAGLGTGAVDTSVAVQTLQEALGHHDEFVSTKVTAYQVHREPALYVAVRCRRGISPARASETVHRVVGALDTLLGREVPVLIHISGGFRARIASGTRLDPSVA